jgi:hypothetical protein
MRKQLVITCVKLLLRYPAAVHIPGHAAHVVAGPRAEKHRQFAQLFGSSELHGGLFFAQQLAFGVFVGNVLVGCFGIHLLLNQRGSAPSPGKLP